MLGTYLEKCALFTDRQDYKIDICFKLKAGKGEEVIQYLCLHHLLCRTNVHNAYKDLIGSVAKKCKGRSTFAGNLSLRYIAFVKHHDGAFRMLQAAAMKVFVFGFWTK